MEHVDLEVALRSYVDAARAAWPEFELSDVELVRYIAARTPEAKIPIQAHAADMLLACACAHGVPTAAAAFDRCFRPVILRILARRGAKADSADDALQTVFETLLVGGLGKLPKIADYRGTGPLRSWVATAVVTTLLMAHRAEGRRREQSEESEFFADLAGNADTELSYLKQRYQKEMAEAVEHALLRLGDRERTLLRLHLGEKMTIDELGVTYRVNRATAARWLAAARDSLIRGTRGRLRERLGLSERECDSIVALAHSQLQVSILRRLS